MQATKTILFDGKKAVNMNDPAVWTILSGDTKREEIDKLYSVVAWLYRCVSLRGYSVTSMPFEVRRGDTVIYEFDGSTAQDDAPKEIPWIGDLPYQLGKVEVANILGGRAYLQRQQSIMETIMGFRWLVPWSVEPIYNKVTGELLHYKRTFGEATRPPEILTLEEVVNFWLPDYAVENGPAINHPGRAVLQNAGVIKGLDLFLAGYFDRGMIKATLLKYQNALSPDEKDRVKEWWRRIFTGIANAFATEVVRGDFEVMTIGDGIKDLRDNKLNQDEKDSIAVGLGIPPSKLLPVGVNRATKDGDDRGYIEDTILPEIGWIYRVCNKQIFNPMGLSIVAKPQELRVMQSDEVERSEAFRNYVGNGMSAGYPIEIAESILGIYVPDDLKEQVRRESEERIAQQGAAAAPPPLPPQMQQPEPAARSLDIISVLDKRDERDQLLRWLKNRDYTAVRVSEFETQFLSHEEKLHIAGEAAKRARKALAVDNHVDEYGDRLARYVRANIDRPQDVFRTGFEAEMDSGLLEVFKMAAAVPDGDGLTLTEQAAYNDLLNAQKAAVPGYVDAIYANKGAIFDAVRENLQGLGANLGGRLQMWKNAARMFWNRGLIVGRRKEQMTWVIGGTEKSCNDCLFYNGQTKTKEEWATLAGVLIYPQSRALECSGYNCDCALVLE